MGQMWTIMPFYVWHIYPFNCLLRFQKGNVKLGLLSFVLGIILQGLRDNSPPTQSLDMVAWASDRCPSMLTSRILSLYFVFNCNFTMSFEEQNQEDRF